jgi:Uma2 family endonuclease
VEIASSSRAVDLHAKRADYARHGVLEYLVFCVREREVRWFDLARDTELRAEADGIVRIHAFPGLWIDAAALIAGDLPKAIATLERGLATPEHAAFVERLANARR